MQCDTFVKLGEAHPISRKHFSIQRFSGGEMENWHEFRELGTFALCGSRLGINLVIGIVRLIG